MIFETKTNKTKRKNKNMPTITCNTAGLPEYQITANKKLFNSKRRIKHFSEETRNLKRGFFNKILEKFSVESEEKFSDEKPKKSSGIPIRAIISEDQNRKEGVRFVPSHLCRRVQSQQKPQTSVPERMRVDLHTKKDPKEKKPLIKSPFSISEKVKPGSPFTISEDQSESLKIKILLDMKNQEVEVLKKKLSDFQELAELKNRICQAKIKIAGQKMRQEIARERLQDLEELEEPPRWP